MRPLDRVLTTLAFHEPDRVPFFEQGVASNVASAILGRPAMTGGGRFRQLGVEAAIAGPDAYREYEETYFSDWCELSEALDFDVVMLPWAGGGVPTRKIDEHTYLFGDLDGSWQVMRCDPVSDTFHVIDSSIRGDRGLEEVEEAVCAEERHEAERAPFTPASFGLLQRLIDRYGHERAVAAGPCLHIPMERAWFEAMMVRPDLVERHTALQASQQCEMVDVMSQMGVHILWGGGDLAANRGPMYSPDQFRRFMLEPLKRITDRCHAHRIPYIFRTDGVIWPIADLLFVESGSDGYGEVDRQAGMRLEAIRKRFPRLILWGNVDCGRTLTEGTPEAVATETRACIDAAASGGGYLLGSSNVIHSGVPPENLIAMVDTCKEYGRY